MLKAGTTAEVEDWKNALDAESQKVKRRTRKRSKARLNVRAVLPVLLAHASDRASMRRLPSSLTLALAPFEQAMHYEVVFRVWSFSLGSYHA